MVLLDRLPSHPSITTRIVVLILMVVVLVALSLAVTGELFPSDRAYALVFQSGLLVAIFGSLVLEDKFTKPADALVNATFVLVALLPYFSGPWDLPLVTLVVYSLVVLSCGFINLLLLGDINGTGIRKFALIRTSEIATTFGKSKLLHSFLFLYAVHVVHTTESSYSVLLLLFWAVHLAMWPLKLPHILDAFLKISKSTEAVGRIVRVEVPNIVKVKLERSTTWTGKLIAILGDGTARRIVPLYTQLQGEEVIGTALIAEIATDARIPSSPGTVITLSSHESLNESSSETIGIVCEGSRISAIRFETWKHEKLREGLLVYFLNGEDKIFYQVSDAQTKQEVFEGNRHGFQVVEANQLGMLQAGQGFRKYPWLPEINSPIFLAKRDIQGCKVELSKNEMILGVLPGTDVELVSTIDEMISHHTAILGITGSGKTELAFRIIGHAIRNQTKVFCVDITGDYIGRLNSLRPQELSIDENLATQLGQRLHDVETGNYRASNEKKVLKEFTDKLRQDIDGSVAEFMNDPSYLGVFTLRSISNTKATIQATEIYLTSLFKYARENTENRRPILVVLEEAHTVIPEASTMGLGDFDSKGMVAKIAQIALQGRKYDVGLLVVAQRTATVSKTVLTQCNTMISFSSFDKTGLDFLSNIYGSEHTSKISNLLPYHALAFGKGVKSERPIIVEMPPLDDRAGK